MITFPPKAFHTNGTIVPRGYSFIFSRESINASIVNLNQLISQILLVISLTVLIKLAKACYEQAMEKVTP